MRSFKISGKLFRIALIIAAFGAISVALNAQSMMKANPSPANLVAVSGTIAAINGTTIFVTAPDGSAKTVVIQPKTLFMGRKLVALESIKKGEALGVTATKAADGSLTATSINIFSSQVWQAPSMRKGQWTMDNGKIMTNAEVDKLASTVKGRTLYMKYQMLTAAIAVPESAEIRRMVPMKFSDIKPGQTISARGSVGSDNSLNAMMISFDVNDK